MSNDVTSIIRVGIERTSTGISVLSDYLPTSYEESVRYVASLLTYLYHPPLKSRYFYHPLGSAESSSPPPLDHFLIPPTRPSSSSSIQLFEYPR